MLISWPRIAPEHFLAISFTLVVFAFIASGCAVPVPLSERTLFQAEYPEWEETRPFGFVGMYSLAADPVRRWVQQQFTPAEDGELQTLNPRAAGFAVGIPLLRRPDAELDLSVGVPVLGLDGTMRVWDQTAVTASAGWGRGQAIVQRALHDSRHVGLGLGVFGRVDRIRVDTEQAGFDLGPEETGYIPSVGGRVMVRGVSPPGAVIRGIVSAGYAPALDMPVIRFGFAIYGFR